MLEMVERIGRHLGKVGPGQKLVVARELLAGVGSLLELVEAAGYKVDDVERGFFKSLPEAIDAAMLGAIRSSVESRGRTKIDFDVSYLVRGSDYSLTLSAPKRTGQVRVVLQAPMPERMGTTRGAARGRTKAAGRRRTTTRKRAPARKRRR